MNDIVLAVISATLLMLLLIAGIVIVLFSAGRQRIRQRQVLAETRLAFEREIRQVETEVSEQVMAQFAEELHDNIGQLLTAMHVQIENQKLDHPRLADSFKPVEIYLAETTRQLRLLSRTLNHEYIGRIGLPEALQLEIDRLRALRRFTVHWEPVQGASHLDKDQELMVFRIFQEIVQNALRHSSAANFYVSLDNRKGRFELRVRDDGKGFDKAEIMSRHKASGLHNILKRAGMAGLQCEIQSAPEAGVSFIIKQLPL